MFLTSFGMSVILASQNELGSVPSLSISWKSLSGCIYSTLKIGQNSALNLSGPELVFFGKLFIAAPI
jgi:hypothetical protein